MTRIGITNSSHPFPPIPGSLKAGYGVDELVIRPFGQNAADIDVDFQHPFRPLLVTRLLQCCTQKRNGEKIGEGFFRDLPVNKRIEALFSIFASTRPGTSGNPELVLQMHCREETCNELIETGITREDIQAVQSQSDEPGDNTGIFPIPVNGREYFFRKPTGKDQLQWLQSDFPDERTAAAAMVRTLWIPPGESKAEPGPPFTGAWLEAVNEGMKTADPLVHFEITVYCPVCNKKNHYIPDLEERLTRELQKVQGELLDTVHCLASYYHWSESQILAIPAHRRAYYLSRLEKGGLEKRASR